MAGTFTTRNLSWVVWSSFFVVLFLGYLIKRPCVVGNWGGTEKIEYTRYCYNDIQALYGARGLSERKIPYFEVLPYEYPPLIAGQMYLTSLVSRNHGEFFVANWWVNVCCYALVVFLLLRLTQTPSRVVYFCISSCLLLYAGMNWDASSVLLLTLVIYCREREKFFWAGVFGGLSLGGKLFPVFCFLPLLIENIKNRDTIKKMVWGGVVGAGGLYLPLVLFSLWKTGNLDPLLSIFLFHAKRLPEYDTLWHWTAGIFGFSSFDDNYRVFVERVSLVILLFGSLFVLVTKNRSTLWGKCGVLVVILLLVSKIYSPQYAIWLLPFIVLNATPAKWIYAFYLTDAWGFLARFNWYPTMGTPDEFYWKNQLMWAVFFRTFVLLGVIYFWLCGPKKQPDNVPSTHNNSC